MILKEGLKLAGIRAEMVLALVIAANVYREFGQLLVVTEVTGAKHGYGSLHYVGQAADLRIRYFDADTLKKVVEELKKRLGENFDVVLESTHIHIEFQPK